MELLTIQAAGLLSEVEKAPHSSFLAWEQLCRLPVGMKDSVLNTKKWLGKISTRMLWVPLRRP